MRNVMYRNRLQSFVTNSFKIGQSLMILIQGSVSGLYLFNVFLNDLDIKLGSTPALFK